MSTCAWPESPENICPAAGHGVHETGNEGWEAWVPRSCSVVVIPNPVTPLSCGIVRGRSARANCARSHCRRKTHRATSPMEMEERAISRMAIKICRQQTMAVQAELAGVQEELRE
eukprot:9353978-Prorocentrum_lima.AAC.1